MRENAEEGDRGMGEVLTYTEAGRVETNIWKYIHHRSWKTAFVIL